MCVDVKNCTKAAEHEIGIVNHCSFYVDTPNCRDKLMNEMLNEFINTEMVKIKQQFEIDIIQLNKNIPKIMNNWEQMDIRVYVNKYQFKILRDHLTSMRSYMMKPHYKTDYIINVHNWPLLTSIYSEIEPRIKSIFLQIAEMLVSSGRHEEGATIYDVYGMIDDAKKARSRRQTTNVTHLDSKTLKIDNAPIQNAFIDNSNRSVQEININQSVLNRTNIGETKPFKVCPYCGEPFNLQKTPIYCPYCGEQLSIK